MLRPGEGYCGEHQSVPDQETSTETSQVAAIDPGWCDEQPGVERPLRFPRQFPRNVGRTLKVKIRSGDAVEHVEGTLAGATGEEIQLGLTGENLRTIPYRDIIEARVIADISNKPLR